MGTLPWTTWMNFKTVTCRAWSDSSVKVCLEVLANQGIPCLHRAGLYSSCERLVERGLNQEQALVWYASVDVLERDREGAGP